MLLECGHGDLPEGSEDQPALGEDDEDPREH